MTSSRLKLRALGLVVALSLSVVALGSGGFVGTAAAANTATAPDCSTVSYAGTGAANNPYEVENVDQLQCIGAESTGTSLSDDYELVDDIDASGTSEWNEGAGFDPIGGVERSFTGTFDGANHTIEGLFIDRQDRTPVGLFSTVGSTFPAKSGKIRNVSLVDADVTGDIGAESDNTGTLVGKLTEGTITNASATGAVDGGNKVGGLVGDNTGDIRESKADVAVNGSGVVGGLVGRSGGTDGIKQSYATGNVSSDGTTGGLVGNLAGGSITQSYATGNVSGGNGVGGLVGAATGTPLIEESYAVGFVSASGSDVGGLVGANFGTVEDSYWDVNTTNQTSSAGGTDLTTDQLRTNTSLGGFDFTNTWDVVDTNDAVSYPFLWNNTQTPAPGLERLYAGGDGSAANPYEISDWEELNNARRNLGANYTLVNDLNASTAGYADIATQSANGGNGFEPIASDSNRFSGAFDGANHTISALQIDRTNEGVGLFGATDSDTDIRDVTVRNVDVTYGDSFAGGGVLVGVNRGNITNVSAGGTMVVADGGFDAGGLVGLNEGRISNSKANVAVSDTGNVGNLGGLVGSQQSGGTIQSSSATGDVLTDDGRVGGLVGSNGQFGVAVIRDSYATGDVEGTSSVGGLAGDQQSSDAVIENSYATGNVDGSDSSVGGLVGDQSRGAIDGAYATGTVTGQDGADSVGGLVGSNAATITESNATGSVTGNDGGENPSEQVGGLVGANAGGTITEAHAAGDTAGSNNVGGLVGENVNDFGTAVLNESYATGAVDGDERAGGAVGLNSGNITDTYATGSVTAQTNLGGIAGQNQGLLERVYAAGAVNPTEPDTAGGLIGQNGEDGQVFRFAPDDGANGTVRDSYWDTAATGQSDAVGKDGDDASGPELTASGGDSVLEGEVLGRTTAEMTGVNATDNMAGFAFTDTWHVTASYPVLAWDNTDPFYAVNISDVNASVTEGETVSVTATVTNWGADSDGQNVTLTDTAFSDEQQDSETVALASGASDETVTLVWTTSDGDAGSGNLTVASGTDTDTASVTVTDAPVADVDAAVTADEATADGTDDVRFTVTLTDRFGEPVEGAAVDVDDAADVDALGGLSAGETNATDADGEATFTATSTDDGAFTVQFSAADAGKATATATFEPELSGGTGGSDYTGGDSTPPLESDDVDGFRTAGSNVTAAVVPSISGGVAESQFELNDVEAAELDYSDTGTSYRDLSNVTIESIDIEYVEPTDTELTTRQSADPVGTDAGLLGDRVSLGYLQTETGVENDRIADVRVEFTVPAVAVQSADGGPEAVSMYRFDTTADEWTRLDTTLTSDTGDELRYRVTTDRLSQFAVGVEPSETTDGPADNDTGSAETDPSEPSDTETATPEPSVAASADTGETGPGTDDTTPSTELGGISPTVLGAVLFVVLALLAAALVFWYR